MLPEVNPVALMPVVPQATEVKPAHVPENSCIPVPEVVRLDPTEVNNILTLAADGVYLYQTSSSGVPVTQPVGMPPLAVADHTVPLLFVTPFERVTAPAQSSLAGGG